MNHSIKINAGAASLLKSCLRRPEWPANAQELVTALLLADKITVKQSLAELDAHKPVAFSLPEPLRDICKRAVSECATRQLLPASEFSKSLILAFGIATPPKELEDVSFEATPTETPTPAQG